MAYLNDFSFLATDARQMMSARYFAMSTPINHEGTRIAKESLPVAIKHDLSRWLRTSIKAQKLQHETPVTEKSSLARCSGLMNP